MNPGTRPGRSSRFGASPDNGQSDGAGAPEPDHPDIPPRFRRAFAGQPDQVAQARRFVEGALAGCPALADVVLLTSELATNAVQHSATGRGGAFVVAISHGPGRVKVTVTDGGSATRPVIAPEALELAVSGRGLLLVDVLADRWGYTSDLDHPAADRALGTSGAVWFELACRPG
jgi:anti-sigma regulatory factor (Ser/Thr protein kinase)